MWSFKILIKTSKVKIHLAWRISGSSKTKPLRSSQHSGSTLLTCTQLTSPSRLKSTARNTAPCITWLTSWNTPTLHFVWAVDHGFHKITSSTIVFWTQSLRSLSRILSLFKSKALTTYLLSPSLKHSMSLRTLESSEILSWILRMKSLITWSPGGPSTTLQSCTRKTRTETKL